MQLAILARSDRWVVVRKPAGLLVHRRQGHRHGLAAVQVLRDQLGQHVWPVHRLDRATSGCLLFALAAHHVTELHAALVAGTKRYLVMVRGDVAFEQRDEERPLKNGSGTLQAAHTHLRKLAGSPDPRASLLIATPTTGRTHQIRRHLAGLSHPVLGDSTHGDTRVNRTWRQQHGLPRLALHCWSMALDLPEGPLNVMARVPDDLWRVWKAQPWWDRVRPQLEGPR